MPLQSATASNSFRNQPLRLMRSLRPLNCAHRRARTNDEYCFLQAIFLFQSARQDPGSEGPQ